MNFKKISEGLIETIEKLSENKNNKTVTETLEEKQKLVEEALGEQPAPPKQKPGLVPAAVKEIKPLAPAEPEKPKVKGAFGPGQAMTPAGAEYLKNRPKERKAYLKQVSTQKLQGG